MNIALISSQGGHSGQLKILFNNETLGENNAIFVTEKEKISQFSVKNSFNSRFTTYFFPKDYLGINPFRYLVEIKQLMSLFRKEKIDLIVTNGAQISIPAVIAAKLLGIRSVYMETIIRVKTTTWSAKVCYLFADTFLVQHPWMVKKYGRKAQYKGGII